MSNLVFLEPNKLDAVPFTTSEVIAEHAKVNYRSIQRLIEKHSRDFEEFGQVRFVCPSRKNGQRREQKTRKKLQVENEV